MCCSRCGPRLSEAAGAKLQNRYVLMRGGTREAEANAEKRLAIPITVRWVPSRQDVTVLMHLEFINNFMHALSVVYFTALIANTYWLHTAQYHLQFPIVIILF